MSPHSDSEQGAEQPKSNDVARVETPYVHLVATQVHGRYLASTPDVAPPWPVLAGFHGYGENAEDHLRELAAIPGAREWLLVAVQALHAFYTRNDERVVASWMTRLDREHAIADNLAYVGRVVGDVRRRYVTRAPLVFCGFSQGGAMAYRAAAKYPAEGLIILAADVPPDVAAGPTAPLPPVLLGRGARDGWYTEEKQAADVRALAGVGVQPEVCVFDGGHQWSDSFRDAAGTMLRRLLQR